MPAYSMIKPLYVGKAKIRMPNVVPTAVVNQCGLLIEEWDSLTV